MKLKQAPVIYLNLLTPSTYKKANLIKKVYKEFYNLQPQFSEFIYLTLLIKINLFRLSFGLILRREQWLTWPSGPPQSDEFDYLQSFYTLTSDCIKS